MNWRNTSQHYGYIAQIFHWMIALSFVGMFIVAEVMMHMTTDPQNTFFDQSKWDLYSLHKSVGMTLLVLIALRLLWKISNPKLPILGPNALQRLIAKVVHIGLYVVMFTMPVSGYIMSSAGGHGVKVFGLPLPDLLGTNKPLASLAHEAHEITAEVIYILVALHIVGALYHHYVVKDDTFIRLWWRGPNKH